MYVPTLRPLDINSDVARSRRRTLAVRAGDVNYRDSRDCGSPSASINAAMRSKRWLGGAPATLLDRFQVDVAI